MSDDWPPRPPATPPLPGEGRRPAPEARDPGGRDRGEPPGPAPRAPDAVDPPGADGRGSDEPRGRDRRALGFALTVVLGFIVIAALVGGNKPPASATFPPIGATVGPAGDVVGLTRGDVIRALSAQGLQAEDAVRPYRPAEAPAFATAPRILLRAILPDDPDHGLIVIYQFANPQAATAAAQEQAAYLASGVGGVQFPPDSRFILRVDGSTAVFFTWSPESSPDQRTASIGTALATVGLEVPVPN